MPPRQRCAFTCTVDNAAPCRRSPPRARPRPGGGPTRAAECPQRAARRPSPCLQPPLTLRRSSRRPPWPFAGLRATSSRSSSSSSLSSPPPSTAGSRRAATSSAVARWSVLPSLSNRRCDPVLVRLPHRAACLHRELPVALTMDQLAARGASARIHCRRCGGSIHAWTKRGEDPRQTFVFTQSPGSVIGSSP